MNTIGRFINGEIVNDETGPPHIDTNNNEHSQLWFYQNWSVWMAAESWQELRAIQPPLEGKR